MRAPDVEIDGLGIVVDYIYVGAVCGWGVAEGEVAGYGWDGGFGCGG